MKEGKRFRISKRPRRFGMIICFLRWAAITITLGTLLWSGCHLHSEKDGKKGGSQVAGITETKSTEETRIEEAAVEYLTQRKHWKRAEYRLEYKGTTEDKRFAVVWAIYLRDETNPMPGSGQSVALHVDRNKYRVVEELGWQ